MTITTIILSALLTLAFLGAGVGKLRRAEPVTGTLESLGVTPGLQKTIGALEVLGAFGVLVGLWFRPLGVAAAVGLAFMMIGAVLFHLRARDTMNNTVGALVLLAFTAVVGGFQLATA